jgi:signal transduction histidine kinase
MTASEKQLGDAVGTEVIKSGTLHFSVEAKLLRELGERLVKQPEVAFVELIKNAHDADAETCTISFESDTLVIADDGHGMTLQEFEHGWMRIGSSAKAAMSVTRWYDRPVTGEKGIGRFAVRFLGGTLQVHTVADDPERKRRTVLEAYFDWSEVDRYEDLGRVAVPYTLRSARSDEALGTSLVISELRIDMSDVNWSGIRTASISLLSPVRALLEKAGGERRRAKTSPRKGEDPGFALTIRGGTDGRDELENVAEEILDSYVLRTVVKLRGKHLKIDVYSRPRTGGAETSTELTIRDTYENELKRLDAEIRFYPKRKGSFAGLPVDGRRALGWVVKHSGVAIYDRSFRVLPYGLAGDDWLKTARDTARRARDPRSTVAMTHFPMSPAEARSTELNYMLRLPHPQQLIGVVLVESSRTPPGGTARGLVPSADREGFVDNRAYQQLVDIIRGAVEAIAHVDRKLQKQAEDAERNALIERLRTETRQAIAEIQANPRLQPEDRAQLIKQFARTQAHVEQHEAAARSREEQLEVLSLLGVVAGFMTHEFGVALDALQQSRVTLLEAAEIHPELARNADKLEQHITTLKDFATYSRAYIGASAEAPSKPYPARPRIQQVVRIFGGYAAERQIEIEIDVARDVLAPPVPVALYNGVALNLYTNALKAVAARTGGDDRRIKFRAWNEGTRHVLLVADTGVGIPTSFRERIFEPLITTTSSNTDPLGSGLGLGLTLVRRAVESFRGRVAVVDPPAGFSTAVEINLPLPKE